MIGNEEIFNRIYKGNFLPNNIDYPKFKSTKGADTGKSRIITGFRCPNQNACQVNELKEPIWTLFWG